MSEFDLDDGDHEEGEDAEVMTAAEVLHRLEEVTKWNKISNIWYYRTLLIAKLGWLPLSVSEWSDIWLASAALSLTSQINTNFVTEFSQVNFTHTKSAYPAPITGPITGLRVRPTLPTGLYTMYMYTATLPDNCVI